MHKKMSYKELPIRKKEAPSIGKGDKAQAHEVKNISIPLHFYALDPKNEFEKDRVFREQKDYYFILP